MTVSSVQIASTDLGGGRLEARFTYNFSNGEIVRDGPRVFPAATDLNAAAASYGALKEAEMLDRELEYCVFDGTWDFVLKYATNNQLAAFVRECYRNERREILARIARRILEWITNGRFTDTQVRNAFELTVTQWNTLKAKMQVLADSLNTIEAAVGE